MDLMQTSRGAQRTPLDDRSRRYAEPRPDNREGLERPRRPDVRILNTKFIIFDTKFIIVNAKFIIFDAIFTVFNNENVKIYQVCTGVRKREGWPEEIRSRRENYGP